MMSRVTPWFDRFRTDTAATVLLALLVFTVFAVTTTFDFVDYDDREVVLDNPFVRGGLTWPGLRWAWGIDQRPDIAKWYNWPLTWMTHQLDCQVYGLWAGGHHLTNVVLHAGGTLAFFAVLRTMAFSTGTALVLAAIYGIHPAQIESVAWVTSRKNVLSAVFFFGAIAAYLHAHGKPGDHRGIAAWLTWHALALAAMLSKATTVTLPVVLMMMDWWPLRRYRLPYLDPPPDGSLPAAGIWRIVGEKTALLAFAGSTIALGYVAQSAAGAIHHETPSVVNHLEHATRAVAAYLRMFFCPVRLSPLYLGSDQPPDVGVTLACGLLIVSLTVAAVVAARRYPAVALGWLWFLVTLAPAIGLVRFGLAAWACRHLQIPMAGLLISMGALWIAAIPRLGILSIRLGILVAAVIIGLCGILTLSQITMWRNAPALAEAQLQDNPTHASVWNTLAIILDRHAAAPPDVIEGLFRHAASLASTDKQHLEIAHDYGLFLIKQHENERACLCFRECLRRASPMPSAGSTRSNIFLSASTHLAIGLTRLQKTNEAVSVLRALHDRHPATATSLNALGNALTAGGDHSGALDAFAQAVVLDPEDITLLCNAATAAARAGEQSTARQYLAQAQTRDPDSPAVAAAKEILRTGE